MTEALVFQPPRRRGRTFLAILLPIPALLAAAALFQALQQPPGLVSSIYILLCILLAAVIPWIGYRLYALSRSGYALEREGMRIMWGLRGEDIPMTAILWVRPASEIGSKLPLPLLRLPGAVLGTRRSAELGKIEFLASETYDMVLVMTGDRVYAISPDDPITFMDAFQELVEMGSISSIPAQSIHPTSLVRRVWQDSLARVLIGVSLVLGVGLVVWVAALALTGTDIPLGFLGPGEPRPLTSPIRLILLPVVSTTFLLIDWALGAIFYRQEETRPLAYFLWVAAVITPLLFLGAVYLITSVGG